MQYQIEFQGKKIGKASCKSLSEAKFLLYDIVLECVESRKAVKKNRRLSPSEEVRLQLQLMNILTISAVSPSHSF